MLIINTFAGINGNTPRNKKVDLFYSLGNLDFRALNVIKEIRKKSEFLIVAIYHNPMQFENIKLYEKYPKIYEKDLGWLKTLGVDLVFLPEHLQIFPSGLPKITFQSQFLKILEAKLKPKYFSGLVPVMYQFLTNIPAHRIYFDQWDFQEMLLVGDIIDNFKLKTQTEIIWHNPDLFNSLYQNDLNTASQYMQKEIYQWFLKLAKNKGENQLLEKKDWDEINQAKFLRFLKKLQSEQKTKLEADILEILRPDNLQSITELKVGDEFLIFIQKKAEKMYNPIATNWFFVE
jgi:pantoate--beta-alanine ligase